MIIYYFIYALLLSGVPLTLVNNGKYRRILRVLFFLTSMTLLVLLPGLRSDTVDPDVQNYRDWFHLAAVGSVGIDFWLREPAFFLISSAVSCFGLAYFAVQLIYAFLSMLFYYYFTVLSVSDRGATLCFYLILCRFYLILDFAQIRSGVAIPLMSVSIVLLCAGKRKWAVALYLLALIFHWSVLIGLPVVILLLAGVKFRSRIWISSFVPLTLIALAGLHFIIEKLSFIERLSRYYADSNAAEGLSALSIHFFIHFIVVCWIVCAYWGKLSLLQRVATVCTSLGMFFFVTFVQLSAVAYRFEDIFDLFWVLLIIALLQFSSGMKRIIYILLLIIAGAGLFYVSMKVLRPYELEFLQQAFSSAISRTDRYV